MRKTGGGVVIVLLVFAAAMARADDLAAVVSPVNQLIALGVTVVTTLSAIFGILRHHRGEVFSMQAVSDVVAYCYRVAGGTGEARVQAALRMFPREFVERTGDSPKPAHIDAANYAVEALHLSVCGANALTEPRVEEDDEWKRFNAARVAKGLKPLSDV